MTFQTMQVEACTSKGSWTGVWIGNVLKGYGSNAGKWLDRHLGWAWVSWVKGQTQNETKFQPHEIVSHQIHDYCFPIR